MVSLDQALARATDFFADRETRAGVVARRLLSRPRPSDSQLIEHLDRERRRRTRMDGSADGSLLQTAWTVLELLQLDFRPDHAGLVRMVGYVLGRQNQAGRFGEGCTPERHAHGTCQHFVVGFFSPGGTDFPVGPLTFPWGVTVRPEDDARFAVSCLALRAALRARQEGRQSVRDHVQSLLDLRSLWNAWGGEWAPDQVFFALAALAAAPLAFRDQVERNAAWVAERQRADGGWTGANPIHALEAMLQVPTEPARQAVRRGAGAVQRMAGDGALFSDGADEEMSLVGVRVLRAAAG